MSRTPQHAYRSTEPKVVPDDPKNPGAAYIQAEINSDRRGEYRIILKTVIAVAFIGALVVIRELFFV